VGSYSRSIVAEGKDVEAVAEKAVILYKYKSTLVVVNTVHDLLTLEWIGGQVYLCTERGTV
jgi:hypothetical protein